MKWRCVNHLFDYCKGTPDWSKEPHSSERGNFVGECSQDYETCKKRKTLIVGGKK